MTANESKSIVKSAAAANNQSETEIISANLKKLISHYGITQKDLADLLCVAPASVTDYCKGRRILGTDHLIKLKKHFDTLLLLPRLFPDPS